MIMISWPKQMKLYAKASCGWGVWGWFARGSWKAEPSQSDRHTCRRELRRPSSKSWLQRWMTDTDRHRPTPTDADRPKPVFRAPLPRSLEYANKRFHPVTGENEPAPTVELSEDNPYSRQPPSVFSRFLTFFNVKKRFLTLKNVF